MTLTGMRKALNRASTRALEIWLAECEREHPAMINTEAMIKDELNRRSELTTRVLRVNIGGNWL